MRAVYLYKGPESPELPVENEIQAFFRSFYTFIIPHSVLSPDERPEMLPKTVIYKRPGTWPRQEKREESEMRAAPANRKRWLWWYAEAPDRMIITERKKGDGRNQRRKFNRQKPRKAAESSTKGDDTNGRCDGKD